VVSWNETDNRNTFYEKFSTKFQEYWAQFETLLKSLKDTRVRLQRRNIRGSGYSLSVSICSTQKLNAVKEKKLRLWIDLNSSLFKLIHFMYLYVWCVWFDCYNVIFQSTNLGLRLRINHLKPTSAEVRQQFGSSAANNRSNRELSSYPFTDTTNPPPIMLRTYSHVQTKGNSW